MFFLAYFAALLACSAGAIAPRIVSGIDAEVGEFPWQLSLQLDGSHICGAVPLKENFALTAAHCVDFNYEVNRFRVVCGLHQIQNDAGQVSVVSKIAKHESYDANANGFPNDIAVLKLESNLNFDSRCQPARLPLDNSNTYAGQNSSISGWGRIVGGGALPNNLKKAHIPIITNQVCGRDYTVIIFNPIRDTHICVKDPNAVYGACNGDSGGPLTTVDPKTGNAKVVGLTSFGRTGCDVKYASVYTRVSSYLSWINSKLNSL